MNHPPAASVAPRAASARWSVGVFALVALALFVVRLSGPSDILDNDQLRPAMYALDALRNGNWLCQRDPTGDITSKPPLYTWCIALLSTPLGRVDRLTLYLPCALAMFGAAWIASQFARMVGGARAGLIAGIIVLCSSFGVKHVALARTDAMFGFTVALTAWCAWRAHKTGRGWMWFWLAAAAATLTKGPLGLALGAAGLLGVLGSRTKGTDTVGRGGLPWWAGAPVYLAICGGWFLAAWLQMGQPLVDKMIGRELMGHAVEGPGGGFPGAEFYKPFLYYLSRFAPWSPLTVLALWRVWRGLRTTTEGGPAERFLACWFVGGLIVFSLATHQRADLLLPLVPAGGALAAIELDRLVGGWRRRALITGAMTTVLVTLLCAVVWYHGVRSRDSVVTDTESVRQLAVRLRSGALSGHEIVDIDAPFSLQYFLGTARQRTPIAIGLDRIEAGERVVLATKDAAEATGAARDRGIQLIVLDESENARSTIVSVLGLPLAEESTE